MRSRKSNKAKRHSRGCRNNGPCAYCRSNRLNSARRRIIAMIDKIHEFRDRATA